MAAFIAMLEGLNFLTGRDIYLRISTFWIKIFSIAFGMGVSPVAMAQDGLKARIEEIMPKLKRRKGE
ncbi:cytochrome ubiquinol oxidase subunit I [Mesorhizobium sp. BR1-1-3]|uniref:cytochrome ubiquinol oxidase subunit I n=1 Tax=Mesorhizobium sp. BR1-1-3 TaxID=2876651 RepID=UPI001CD119FA|nr:cytochrome ubiquinol oxidase subunit I [Mesorhizobium sp. BR1-1-3]MBZ9887494.1 cytochrome ubiquinol oxidase subunit I [Mesorhizobium sp. BR1-1-3]